MRRVWKEAVSAKYLHDNFGVYQGKWLPQMDRCWYSDDGFQVMSRIIITDIGKVEHATISKITDGEDQYSFSGERDIPWAMKQEIKNDLFGADRVAIELFPSEKNKVDVMDIYHLWILPKGFKIPFGIHPTRDPQCRVVNRGCPKDISGLLQNYMEISGMRIGALNDDIDLCLLK